MSDIKRLLLILSPFLIIILYPFHISWETIHPKLEKYGFIDNYLFLFSISISSVLLIDFILKRKKFLFKKKQKFFLLGISIFFSLIIRVLFLNFESRDFQVHLSKWYDYIQLNGGFSALSNNGFSDYNPSYLYLLLFITKVPISKLYGIKLVSIIFDYLTAHVVYKIIKLKYAKGWMPVIGASVILFTPTIIINSSLWAQSDIIFTYFLLWSLFYFLKSASDDQEVGGVFIYKKYSFSNALIGVFFFSIALMFKLQSVFFILILVYYYIKDKLELKHFLIIPFVWFLMIVPTLFAGRSLIDLILIYPRQAAGYPHLSLNAPNIYNLIPNAPFEYFYLPGLVFTFFAVICFFLLFLFYKRNLLTGDLLQLALISVILIPYLLPKMHERYFFIADVIAVIYAFYYPKRFFIPILVIMVSLISYTPFLFRTEVTYFSVLSLINGSVIVYLIRIFFYDINLLGKLSKTE